MGIPRYEMTCLSFGLRYVARGAAIEEIVQVSQEW